MGDSLRDEITKGLNCSSRNVPVARGAPACVTRARSSPPQVCVDTGYLAFHTEGAENVDRRHSKQWDNRAPDFALDEAMYGICSMHCRNNKQLRIREASGYISRAGDRLRWPRFVS
jgi:hypothetical protein